jgi:hypothetical protein
LAKHSVADPGSGAFLTLWIRDPGWVKNKDQNLGSGSGMNITNQISESLETIFWVKYLNSLMRMWIQIFDPVSWIRDEKNFNNAESAYII